MKTKPRGIHANFTSQCHVCGGEIVVKDGRPERHECRTGLDPSEIIHWPPPLAG